MRWEEIDHKCDSASDRLQVPGGWIVRSYFWIPGAGATVAQTFVADPDHEWRLECTV